MKWKIPEGIPKLAEFAKIVGIKFGTWIEQEIVDAKSESYKKHLDWGISLPNKKIILFLIQKIKILFTLLLTKYWLKIQKLH